MLPKRMSPARAVQALPGKRLKLSVPSMFDASLPFRFAKKMSSVDDSATESDSDAPAPLPAAKRMFPHL